jgi:hypothetical protein
MDTANSDQELESASAKNGSTPCFSYKNRNALGEANSPTCWSTRLRRSSDGKMSREDYLR